MTSLLIELLTEELPPKALKKLGEAFAQGIAQGLKTHQLTGADSTVTAYATPRRLAVHIQHVAAQSPAQARRDKVLPVAVAFDANGAPQPPLLKKIAAMGLKEADIAKLERAMDGKAQALFYSYTAPGQPLATLLQDVLTGTIAKLPIPKVMFYERDDGTPVNFVRPAHKLVALHGKDVLAVSVLGIQAGNTTRGHRFHADRDITIATADSYAQTLKAAHVLASYAERRAAIQQQLNALAKNDDIIAPDALLDEVNSLVEWPRVYECHFDKEFLEVPQECLILTMQTNQKYFATQKNGKLTHRFLIVSNIEAQDPSLIIAGNERVVRPRLADAKFFFDQDRKHTLESRLPKLANVVYHGKLGSQLDRVKRIEAIAAWVAQRMSGASEAVHLARRAAKLSKADLVTEMVSEFPELQGVMGAYYAKLQDQPEDVLVCAAIREQYWYGESGLVESGSTISRALQLADRAEVLVGIWGIGLKPTGDKDPFALRRAALTVLSVLESRVDAQLAKEQSLDFDLAAFLHFVASTFPKSVIAQDTVSQVEDFIYERAKNKYSHLGMAVVESVISLKPPLFRIQQRINALTAFEKLPEAFPLAAANKRISNILKKSETAIGQVNPALLTEEAEQHLHGALKNVVPIADKLFANHEYAASLRELASLRTPVDTFFDKVMVNAEDPALRANRLALLKTLHTAMNRVADLSKLAA
jgi:glycyl-tRNA synthetase beta chain